MLDDPFVSWRLYSPLVGCLLMLCLLPAIPRRASAQQTAQFPSALEEAEELLANGECEEALLIYAGSARNTPGLAAASVGLARAFACFGEWDDAEACLARVGEFFPASRAEVLADPLFEHFRATGELTRILDRGLLTPDVIPLLRAALEGGPVVGNMRVADVDHSGTPELYLWAKVPHADMFDLVLVRAGPDGELELTHLSSLIGDQFWLDLAQDGLVLLRTRYGNSHGFRNSFAAFHITASVAREVWRWVAFDGDYDTNATIWISVANLDDDPMPELIAFDLWACQGLSPRVFDLVGSEMRAMRRARRRRVQAAAPLRAAALAGDMRAARNVAALVPEDWEVQRLLARHALANPRPIASPGQPSPPESARVVALEDRLNLLQLSAPPEIDREARQEFERYPANCSQNYYFANLLGTTQ